MAGLTTTAAVTGMVPVEMVEDTVRLTVTVREVLVDVDGATVNSLQHRLLVVVVQVGHLKQITLNFRLG